MKTEEARNLVVLGLRMERQRLVKSMVAAGFMRYAEWPPERIAELLRYKVNHATELERNALRRILEERSSCSNECREKFIKVLDVRQMLDDRKLAELRREEDFLPPSAL